MWHRRILPLLVPVEAHCLRLPTNSLAAIAAMAPSVEATTACLIYAIKHVANRENARNIALVFVIDPQAACFSEFELTF